MSSASQRSGESLSQYDQLENVYAPSSTPCYSDTPIHTIEGHPLDSNNMCYLDVKIEHNQADSNDADKKSLEENHEQQRPESDNKSDEAETQDENTWILISLGTDESKPPHALLQVNSDLTASLLSVIAYFYMKMNF